MLGSWFSQRPNDKDTLEGVVSPTTPRPSHSSPTDNPAPRLSTDNPSKRTSPPAYTTPHDAILAGLQGTTHRPFSADSNTYPAEEPVISSDRESITPREDKPTSSQANLLPNLSFPTSQQPPLSNSSDLLLDPFDGMSLGVLIPHQDNLTVNEKSPSQTNLVDPEGGTKVNSVGIEAVWTNLSRVLEIQSQISKMHLEMEGIGTTRAGDLKAKRHKTTKGVPESSGSIPRMAMEDPSASHQPRKRALSTVSTISSTGETEGDDEGVGVPSEEAEKNRIREEEFSKLATQFEGRKEAISGIMGKLDDLSQALHQFHQLSPPTMDVFTTRSSSAGVTSPPISKLSHPETK